MASLESKAQIPHNQAVGPRVRWPQQPFSWATHDLSTTRRIEPISHPGRFYDVDIVPFTVLTHLYDTARTMHGITKTGNLAEMSRFPSEYARKSPEFPDEGEVLHFLYHAAKFADAARQIVAQNPKIKPRDLIRQAFVYATDPDSLEGDVTAFYRQATGYDHREDDLPYEDYPANRSFGDDDTPFFV